MIDLLIIDLETSRENKLHEIGICSLELETGSIKKEFHAIVKEKGSIIRETDWIFKNSSLKFEDVLKAKYIDDYKPEIQTLFDNAQYITAYNCKFDLELLIKLGFNLPEVFFDPMIVLTDMLMIHNQWGYKYPSMEEAYRFLFPSECAYREKHRALEDALDEAKIIRKTYQLLKQQIGI